MFGKKYYHHGIFVGHEKGVCDFGGTNKADSTVRIIDILPFIDYGRRQLIRYIYTDTECLPPDKAASNAEMIHANPLMWGPYDLLNNNCEHFATRCKIGRAVSLQVLKRLDELYEAIAGSITTAGAAAFSLSYK